MVVTESISMAGMAPMVRMGGLNVLVALDGRPETENVVWPLKPPTPVSVIWNCAVCPDVIVTGVAPEPETETTVKVGVMIVSATELEVLPRKFPFTGYTAVIECVPTARVEVVYTATPLLRVAVARVVVPSRKETLPAGTPALDDTVAVRVTLTPGLAELEDKDATVVVTAGPTKRVT